MISFSAARYEDWDDAKERLAAEEWYNQHHNNPDFINPTAEDTTSKVVTESARKKEINDIMQDSMVKVSATTNSNDGKTIAEKVIENNTAEINNLHNRRSSEYRAIQNHHLNANDMTNEEFE